MKYFGFLILVIAVNAYAQSSENIDTRQIATVQCRTSLQEKVSYWQLDNTYVFTPDQKLIWVLNDVPGGVPTQRYRTTLTRAGEGWNAELIDGPNAEALGSIPLGYCEVITLGLYSKHGT